MIGIEYALEIIEKFIFKKHYILMVDRNDGHIVSFLNFYDEYKEFIDK
jgi:hypothetical protein